MRYMTWAYNCVSPAAATTPKTPKKQNHQKQYSGPAGKKVQSWESEFQQTNLCIAQLTAIKFIF